MGEGKKKYKYDIVADQILEEIRKGRWKVGDRLPPEAELALEFCVSRVCLREGLKKLNVLGIVKIMQGDGTYVNEVNPSEFMKPLFNLLTVTENDIDEIYNARLFVESGACRLAAKTERRRRLRYLSVISTIWKRPLPLMSLLPIRNTTGSFMICWFQRLRTGFSSLYPRCSMILLRDTRTA